MTNETMLKTIAAMLYEHDRATGASGAADVLANPGSWAEDEKAALFLPFYWNAARLITEIQGRMDSAGKPAGTLAALKRINKDAFTNSKGRPWHQGMFLQQGKWCICDGFRAVRLNDDVPSLSHADNSPDNVSRRINLDEIFPDPTAGELVDLPAVPELKTWIAVQKAECGKEWCKGNPYRLHAGKMEIGVNPQYLLDMLQALPGCTARATSPISPIYFTAENGDGILLPVRLQKRAAA
ncbi:MAG: hypothetical protein LUE89_11295 [Clostridiales bacterium]|nr:hypothetical protein [Clostridiales bacterium]